MFLTRFASKVTLIHRRDELRASKIMQDKAKANPKIEWAWNSTVEDVLGDNDVEGVTLKDVKKRWGHGQEDVFPVAQFEKLWGDMTALPGVTCTYVSVPRARGQQLKEQAQLDGWLRDGSAAYVEGLCDWG